MLFDNITVMAQVLKNEPVLLFFSTGRDSIVMCDLFFKHYNGEKKMLFLYFVDGLESKERIIGYYEKRWKTKIEKMPCFVHLNMKQNKKKYKMADIEKMARMKYNITYIATGVRKCESMARRGMMANLKNGIDARNKKLYPLAEWSNKDVEAYCKYNKLLLPVEYSLGAKHEITAPAPNAMPFIKRNMQKDYVKMVETFPQLEGITWAQTD